MSDQTSPSGDYPTTSRNRVKRRHDRGAYDHASVHAVLDAGFLCHVAYVIDGQPYCTPTIHWREGTHLYWHGSSASRMLRAQAKGLPVCVTVSHLDGIVMARTGFNHSANYRSAMCFGTARIVTDKAEKNRALLAMIERYFPGRNASLRPFSAQELKATTLIGMEIEDASAKVRDAMNGDEPEDMDNPSWAGVIPVTTLIGTLKPCPHNPEAPVMDGVAPYAEGARLDQVMSDMASRFGAGPAD